MPKIGETRPPGLPKGSIIQPGGPIDPERVPARVIAAGLEAIKLWREILQDDMWGRVVGRADIYRIVRYVIQSVKADRLAAVIEDPEIRHYRHFSLSQKLNLLNKWDTSLNRIEIEFSRRMAAVTAKDPKAAASKRDGARESGQNVPWANGKVN